MTVNKIKARLIQEQALKEKTLEDLFIMFFFNAMIKNDNPFMTIKIMWEWNREHLEDMNMVFGHDCEEHIEHDCWQRVLDNPPERYGI